MAEVVFVVALVLGFFGGVAFAQLLKTKGLVSDNNDAAVSVFLGFIGVFVAAGLITLILNRVSN